jgi:hypothetical protein
MASFRLNPTQPLGLARPKWALKFERVAKPCPWVVSSEVFGETCWVASVMQRISCELEGFQEIQRWEFERTIMLASPNFLLKALNEKCIFIIDYMNGGVSFAEGRGSRDIQTEWRSGLKI